jgi:hypothetical protein
MRLHVWLYDIVSEVCFERDYLYLAFYRHFSTLLGELTERGRVCDRGETCFAGVKSNLQVTIEWQLEHRLTWSGPNRLLLTAHIQAIGGGQDQEVRRAAFDLSTGDEV